MTSTFDYINHLSEGIKKEDGRDPVISGLPPDLAWIGTSLPALAQFLDSAVDAGGVAAEAFQEEAQIGLEIGIIRRQPDCRFAFSDALG